MRALSDPGSTGPVRPWPVLVGGFIGFLVGELLAALLETAGATLAHFPGGVSRLASLSVPPWWSTLLGVVGLWIGFAGAIVFARTRAGLLDWPHQWRFRGWDPAFLLLGVLAQGVIDQLYAWAHVSHLNGPVNKLFGGAHGASFVVMGLVTVLGSPVIEEWLFRGVLFRAMAQGWPTRYAPAIAALVSAVLFAGAHGEARQFAGLAALGLLLAALTWRTRRLAPAILVHVGFNATAFTALALQRAGH